jgi:hypothetical protein
MPSSANPWAVVSVAAPNAANANASATPPAAAPASSAPDPWAVKSVSAPAAGQAGQGGGLGDWAARTFEGKGEEGQPGSWGDSGPGELLAGAVKSGGRGLASLIDFATPSNSRLYDTFARDYKVMHPQANDQEIKTAYPESIRARLAGHVQDAAAWLKSGSEPEGFWEHVGAIGEQTLEYVGTDGLLKMAGGGVKAAAQVGSKAAGLGEELKNAQQVAATLKSNPKLAGLVSIGLKASKDAAMLGAQTYVHTEDPTQAAIAGGFGGGVSAATGGAAAWLNRNAVKNLSIAGEKVPALASQVNEAGLPMDTGARGAPAVAQAQQRGAQAVIRNTAAQATAAALDKINQTRPAFTATEDASRMLPAPEGSQPFTFSLQLPTNEGVEGQALHRAEPLPGSSTTPATYGKWTPEDPSVPYRASPNAPVATAEAAKFGPFERTQEGGVTREGRRAAYAHPATDAAAIDNRTDLEKLEGEPGPRPAVEGKQDVTRHGPLQTTDPREAGSWLRQLEDLQSTPEYSRLPEAQQNAIEEQRQALSEQLGMYHASPYGQRFAPANVFDGIANVRTFGNAADEIESWAKPVYSTLDRVSGGDFNKYKEAAKQARGVMQRSTTVEAYESALSRLNEANRAVDDIIDSNRGAVSTTDYLTAKNAWRQSARLDELHGVFERMMNGVTAEESEQGLTRIMTGRAKDLERYLAKDTNREQLEQLMGKEGIFNLKQITLLLSRANTSRATHDVLRNTWTALAPHVGRAGAGALIGYTAASAVGANPWHGAAAGALTADGLRYVLRTAATSPRIGNMVEYAARNGLKPQHYAPLIARAIAEPFENTENTEEEGADAQQPTASPTE